MSLSQTLTHNGCRWGVVIAAAVILTCAVASGANASASLVVGPERQVLTNGGVGDTVLVANQDTATDTFTVTTSCAVGDSHAIFHPGTPAECGALVVTPTTFTLKPNQTVHVHVLKEGPIAAPLIEVVFTFSPTKHTGTGVIIQGQVASEFTIHPDQLYVAPPTSNPMHNGQTLWVGAMLLIVAVCLSLIWKRHSQANNRKRQQKAWTW